jgi:transcriptional regulator with XRE-family HTH domain
MARKKKKLTRRQVADSIGESEAAIKMIENKDLPEDALILVKKLEQLFGIELRPKSEIMIEKAKPVSEMVKEEPEKRKPATILKVNPKSMQNLTIADLREMKEERDNLEREKIEKLKDEQGNLKVSDLIGHIDKEEKEEEIKKQEEGDLVGGDIELLDE